MGGRKKKKPEPSSLATGTPAKGPPGLWDVLNSRVLAIIITAVLVPLVVLVVRARRSSLASTAEQQTTIKQLDEEVAQRLLHFSRKLGTAEKPVDCMLLLRGLQELASSPQDAIVRPEYAQHGLRALLLELAETLPGDEAVASACDAARELQETLSGELANTLKSESPITKQVELTLLPVRMGRQLQRLNLPRWGEPFANVNCSCYVPAVADAKLMPASGK